MIVVMSTTAPRFISYRRVSSAEQGRSGLGLEAQAAAIQQFISGRAGQHLEDFVEVETGKGSNALERRPQLRAALAAAKKRRAVLVVSKLDRLSRNVNFISGVMESGVDFVVAEHPSADAFTLHIHAAVAQREREVIAERISAALQAKKARGEAVGNVANLRPHNEHRMAAADAFAERLGGTLRAYRGAGMSQRQMVEELNLQGVKTPRGGSWSLQQVQRVLARVALP